MIIPKDVLKTRGGPRANIGPVILSIILTFAVSDMHSIEHDLCLKSI